MRSYFQKDICVSERHKDCC